MQQSVPSHIPRGIRALAFALAATIVVALLPGAAWSMTPTPLQSPTPTPTPVVGNLSVAVTSPTTAEVTAEVISNGGAPPIYYRGFVYSQTAVDSTPELGEFPNVIEIDVPGANNGKMIGVMTRRLSDLIPTLSYSIQGFAVNAGGPAYTGIGTFSTPCPVISLDPMPASGTVGSGYDSFATASGGSGSYVYSIIGLPPGLTFDVNTGELSGVPTTAGSFPFTITATDNLWPCNGTQPYPLAIGDFDVSPQKLPFASEMVGDISPGKTVTISRVGGGPIDLTSFTFSAPQFSISSTSPAACGAPPFTLNTSESCYLTIVYTPDTAAVHGPATLTISHNGSGSSILISLGGVGTAVREPQLYVSNTYAHTVSVIDPVTNLVRKTIPVGQYPANLAGATLPVVGGKVYVPNEGSYNVSVISADTNDPDITATIFDSSLNGPSGVAFTPTGDEAWVVSNYWPNFAVSVFKTSDQSLVTSIPDSATFGCLYGARTIAANPMTTDMYVFSGYPSGKICVFDRLTKTFLRQIDVGGSPSFGLVLPNGSALYVNSAGPDSTVARIALPSGTVTSIPGVEGANMGMKADGSKIYVGQYGGFGVINTATNTHTPIPLTGAGYPFGVAVNDARGRIYVTDFYTNVVHVVDLATDTEILNPGLPIQDPGLNTPQAITAIGSVVAPPSGVAPTVDSLAFIPPATDYTAAVSANVTLTGGNPPVFERGFWYSKTSIEPDPLPGKAGVFTKVVSGTTGPMSTTLTGLTQGAGYTFRAYARNLIGTGMTATDTFATTTVCLPFTLTPPPTPNGLLGVSYSAAVTASGPGTYFYVAGGALPPGLSLSGNTISGVPTSTGRFDISITATETATGCFAGTSFFMYVGTPVAAGDVVISEFRTHGVNSPQDEYVELANRTSGDIVVASQDGSGGWSIAIAPNVKAAFIEDGTVIEKGGHWLAATGSFSLQSYGSPDWVYAGDITLLVDLPDDLGLALFSTANTSSYSLATRLDAVGTVIETDPLFYEGTPDPVPANDTRLPEVVQAASANPPAQTAWARRQSNTGVLVDSGNNAWDFVFVATDAGTTYGPAANVSAVLGAPNPEDSYTVHDVLQSELPASLLDPSQGEDRAPNRVVWSEPEAVDYRRKFTNNTGKDITYMAFKVINLTTINSVPTLSRLQAQLAAASAEPVTVEVPPGSNNFVDVLGSNLDYPGMYTALGEALGGMNSRVIVPLIGQLTAPLPRESFTPPSVIRQGESVAVNIRARIRTRGYYVFVIMPQISFKPLFCGICDAPNGTSRKPERESGGIRPPVGPAPIDPRGAAETRPVR